MGIHSELERLTEGIDIEESVSEQLEQEMDSLLNEEKTARGGERDNQMTGNDDPKDLATKICVGYLFPEQVILSMCNDDNLNEEGKAYLKNCLETRNAIKNQLDKVHLEFMSNHY